MKNKYTEVEVVPFFNPQRDNSHFCLRNLSKNLEGSPSQPRLKNKYRKILSTFFVAVVFLFPLATSSQTIAKQEVVNLTNQQRLNNNIYQLKINPLLEQAAMAKAKDMIADNYFAHFSPSGEKPWDFITAAGYHYKFAGENLAMDFSSATNAVSAWMTSATHQENILSLDYDEIGIAVVEGELEGRNTILIVQMFGKRINAPVENSLVSIDQLKLAIEPEVIPASVPQPVETAEPEITVQPIFEDQKMPAEEEPVVELTMVKPEENITYENNSNLKIESYFYLPSFINEQEFDLFFTVSSDTERLALINNETLIRFRYLKENIFYATIKTQISPIKPDEYQILAFNDHNYNTKSIKLAFYPQKQTKLAKNSQVKGVSTASTGQSILFLFFLIITAELAFLAPELWHIWHSEKFLFKRQKRDSFLSAVFFVLTFFVPYL